jgi:hypothetical protein
MLNQYAGGYGYDIRDDSWPLSEYDPHNVLGTVMFGQPGYVDTPTSFTDPAWHRRAEQAAKLDALAVVGERKAVKKVCNGLRRLFDGGNQRADRRGRRRCSS